MIPAMRRGRLATIVAATAALVAGCALGPDFHRPAAPANAGYTPEPLAAGTTAAGVAGGQAQKFVKAMDIPGQWWMLFHSGPLNRLIDQAFKANPDLAAAQAALREAKESATAAGGALYPQVTAQASAAREKESFAQIGIPGIPLIFNLYNASVAVSYNLDVWGGARRQIESLEAQAEYQRFQLEAAYLTLSANMVTAAVSEASLRAQIAATNDIIKAETEQLGVVRQQFELGGTSRSDVLAQESTLAQTRATLPGLESQLAQTRNQITALAGRFPNQDDGSTFDLAAMQLPADLPVSLPSALVEHRPDVRAAEASLHAAGAQVGVATARQFPQFNLTAQYGTLATRPNKVFTPLDAAWSFGAGVTEPLFDAGQLLHQKRAAVAAFEQAEAQYRSTVIAAFENVANVLRALQSDADALRAQLAAEQSAADSLNIARVQYQAGAITYLILLNAEQTEQTARINLVKAQAARYADTAALFQALGGGWWNRKDAAVEQPSPDRWIP